MIKKLMLIIILILSFGIVSCSTKKSFKMTTNINSDYDLVDLINYSTKSGNLEAIKYVVEKDKYVVEEDRRFKGFKDRLVSSVILPKAAYYGHLEIVKYLVENGADINAKDNNGWTSLIHAAYNGHLEVVKYLVENKADINAIGKYFGFDGLTSLMFASMNGHLEVVKYLVENGANINDRNEALMGASISGHLEVVKYLVENGADINTKDYVGITPLIYASMFGNFELVEYLIEKGADVNIKYKGRKASDYAKNHVKDLFKK